MKSAHRQLNLLRYSFFLRRPENAAKDSWVNVVSGSNMEIPKKFFIMYGRDSEANGKRYVAKNNST